jgi:hypothetical protein
MPDLPKTPPSPFVPGMSSETFDYNHPSPSPQQLDTKYILSREFTSLLAKIQDLVPAGRYRASAITLLEQANFLCTRGVFHNNDGSFLIQKDSE